MNFFLKLGIWPWLILSRCRTMTLGWLSTGHDPITKLNDPWHPYNSFWFIKLGLKAFIGEKNEKLEDVWKKCVAGSVRKKNNGVKMSTHLENKSKVAFETMKGLQTPIVKFGIVDIES